jgi:hypothetical protein
VPIVALVSSQCSAIQRRRVMICSRHSPTEVYGASQGNVLICRINTKGNALSVPLECCLSVVRSATFSSRPSWRSSLPSSLVSWLLSWLPFAYSPFSMGCIEFCNLEIAVEECIDSPDIDVKEKTT